MSYNEIKTLNDLASSLYCYFMGEWNSVQLMHNLKDNLELPSEVLEHINHLVNIKETL